MSGGSGICWCLVLRDGWIWEPTRGLVSDLGITPRITVLFTALRQYPQFILQPLPLSPSSSQFSGNILNSSYSHFPYHRPLHSSPACKRHVQLFKPFSSPLPPSLLHISSSHRANTYLLRYISWAHPSSYYLLLCLSIYIYHYRLSP